MKKGTKEEHINYLLFCCECEKDTLETDLTDCMLFQIHAEILYRLTGYIFPKSDKPLFTVYDEGTTRKPDSKLRRAD